jgi:hypothetical protein
MSIANCRGWLSTKSGLFFWAFPGAIICPGRSGQPPALRSVVDFVVPTECIMATSRFNFARMKGVASTELLCLDITFLRLIGRESPGAVVMLLGVTLDDQHGGITRELWIRRYARLKPARPPPAKMKS